MMDSHAPRDPRQPGATTDTRAYKVNRPVFKFFIGFTAGLCAACLPRLTAALFAGHGQSVVGVQVLDAQFWGLSAVFAIIVGLVVTIVEWRVPATPRATFLSALGIPALISGSLNSTADTQAVIEQWSAYQEQTRRLAQEMDVPIRDAQGLEAEPVFSLGGEEEALEPRSSLWLPGVSVAHAAQAGVQDAADGWPPSVKLHEPRYAVVLKRIQGRDAAVRSARALHRESGLAVKVYRAADGYLVTSGPALPLSEAVQRATQVRRRLGLEVELVPMR
jgi:hypothetical protein